MEMPSRSLICARENIWKARGELLNTWVLEIRKDEINFTMQQAASTMRHLRLVLMILMMMILSHSVCVDSRALRSVGTDESSVEISSSSSSSSSSSANSANNKDLTVRVLVKEQVFTLASGPSRKGSGH